jgi:hypothetical protein
LQALSQFADQLLLHLGETDRQPLGVCELSWTVIRPFHRRIVVSLTPSSSASMATQRELA